MNLTYSQIHQWISYIRYGFKEHLKIYTLVLLGTFSMLLATSASAFSSHDLLSSNYDFATISGTVTDSDGEPLIGVSI